MDEGQDVIADLEARVVWLSDRLRRRTEVVRPGMPDPNCLMCLGDGFVFVKPPKAIPELPGYEPAGAWTAKCKCRGGS